MPYALGLDIGSSSIKGAILDLDCGTVGPPVTRPFPSPLDGLPAGWFEVAPTEIEAAACEVISELLRQAPAPVGLYVSGQMGGTVLVDESGAALGNYLSWRDQRTRAPLPHGESSCLDAMRTRWGDDVLRALGNELQPGSTTSLLFWLAQNDQPERRGMPVSMADYVIGCLGRRTGARPTMHVTQAIGMLDLATSGWHRGAFDLLGLGSVPLPDLVERIEPQVIAEIGGHEFPVFGAYGDQQTALCGAGLEPEELSLNISTGSQVSQRTSQWQPGRYQSRRYFFGDWLNTVTHLPAGRSLNVLFDLLTELATAAEVTLCDPWKHLMDKVAAVPDTGLDVDLAFFAGPLGDRGRIDGITTENLNAGALFYAAFRNMTANYARCAEWLDPKGVATSLVLSGGLTKSAPVLRRMITERFEKPVREAEGEETLLGLLRLARGVFTK